MFLITVNKILLLMHILIFVKNVVKNVEHD